MNAQRRSFGFSLAVGVVVLGTALLSGCSSLFDPTIGLTIEGVERLEVGDLVGAEARFREVLAEEPENPLALNNMGAIAETRGDFARARSYYQLAIFTESDETAIVRDEEISIVTLATINLARVDLVLAGLARRCAVDPTSDPSCAQ